MNMKKTLVSLAAASLIVTSAVAADKGIDIVTTGQAVVYYQTGDAAGAGELFDQDSSNANVGVQLNMDADLKNDFTFGAQLSYIDALGLNKNLVGDARVMQVGGSVPNTQLAGPTATTNDLALTQIFIAKKIANSTVKIGRQELPKSLSPLAFSEDWNVFKNTFEAALIINSDIPNTTLVGAYVGGANRTTGLVGLSTMDDLTVRTTAGSANVSGTAYMLTAQNKSLPMATITASYYNLAKVDGGGVGATDIIANADIGADAVWVDVAIADKDLPMGLNVGLQAGSIMPETKLGAAEFASTTALGGKVSLKPVDALDVTLAFTSVSGEKDLTKQLVAVKNTGTGVKTPLYTQMILNQDAIALDANTFMAKAAYSLGDAGTVIAQGTMTTAGARNINGNGNDFTDLELIYKVKAGEVDFLAAYVNTKLENADDATNTVRVWARYNF
jgi:hypothetical protein